MSTLGFTSIGGSTDAKPINSVWVGLFTATETFIARQGKSYASAAQASNKSKIVIYSDTGAGPGTLLAISDELTGVVIGWNTYTFSNPITIITGTKYYIGIISGVTTYTMTYSATGGTTYHTEGNPTYAAGPNVTWADNSINSWKLSVYLESIATEYPYGTDYTRVILAELNVRSGGNETTRYISNKGFITGATSTPSNTLYLPILIDAVETIEQLSIDGTPSFSISNITINNADGNYTSWLQDIWTNRSIKIYVGEYSLPRSTFVLVFDGIISDIASQSDTTLNFIVSDKMQRLNAPITDIVLGGTSLAKEEIRPVCYGECFNVTPLLEDDPLHRYRVNYGQMERFIEIRDNGVVLTPTTSTSTGQITLTARPAGTITASIQGLLYEGAYIKDTANIIKALVTLWGSSTTRFALADVDTTNFTAFSTANPQAVGYYCNSKINVIEVINELAASIGAQVLCNRKGLLQIFQISLSGTPTATVDTRQIIADTFKQVQRVPVQSTIKLGYCKNWTVQDPIDTGVVTTSKELFKKDMFTVTVSDATVKANYKQTALPETVSSLLVNTTEATAEANRRLTLWKTQRTIYEFQGSSELAHLTIGQTITLTYYKFGLSAGVTAQILSITMNWKTFRPTIQVLV